MTQNNYQNLQDISHYELDDVLSLFNECVQTSA